MDPSKLEKSPTQSQGLSYKHFPYLQRPVIPPIFLSSAAYSRLIRSPTSSSRFEDMMSDRSSINSLISMFSGIETPITTATNETVSDDDSNQQKSEGFSLERFVGKIEDFFKCPLCKKIVKKPQECIYCQNLMCKNCVSNVVKCPYGCESLQVNQPSKFALMSYMKIKIKCCFEKNGCEYIGRIKDITDHEKECDNAEVKCVNPICEVILLKKNKPTTGPAVCSQICRMVLNYKNVMENGSEDLLNQFIVILDEAKERIQTELKSDLEVLMNEAQKKKEEVEEFLKTKELLYIEIDE